MSEGPFPEPWKEGVYQAIHRRRDVRAHFRPGPVPEEVLARVLTAAHHAPSVGFMQPWDFLIVRDPALRARVREAFLKAQAAEVHAMPLDQREAYLKLKLEGILESALNLCVTCDRARLGEKPLGRTAQPQMDLFSAVCAVQNLWLAARAEGLGVGWVSILKPEDLKTILGIPEKIEVVAYLCMGWVTRFPEKPDLEAAGWQGRLPVAGMIRVDCWDAPLDGQWPELAKALKRDA